MDRKIHQLFDIKPNITHINSKMTNILYDSIVEYSIFDLNSDLSGLLPVTFSYLSLHSLI